LPEWPLPGRLTPLPARTSARLGREPIARPACSGSGVPQSGPGPGTRTSPRGAQRVAEERLALPDRPEVREVAVSSPPSAQREGAAWTRTCGGFPGGCRVCARALAEPGVGAPVTGLPGQLPWSKTPPLRMKAVSAVAEIPPLTPTLSPRGEGVLEGATRDFHAKARRKSLASFAPRREYLSLAGPAEARGNARENARLIRLVAAASPSPPA
jgi:hypothetical protein